VSVRGPRLYRVIIRVDENQSTFDCSSGGSFPISVVASMQESQSW